jgi:hypothetical protein
MRSHDTAGSCLRAVTLLFLSNTLLKGCSLYPIQGLIMSLLSLRTASDET